MAGKDGTFDGELPSEHIGGDEVDSLSSSDQISRRDSEEFAGGEGRRHSHGSSKKDAGNEPQRTLSVSDRILGEMEDFLIDSPKAMDDSGQNEDDVIQKPGEDDHEDILDVQAGVDATIDDQFEVLDSAGDADIVDSYDEGKKPSSSSEDTRRRSKRSSEGRSHVEKDSRSRDSDSKGINSVFKDVVKIICVGLEQYGLIFQRL